MSRPSRWRSAGCAPTRRSSSTWTPDAIRRSLRPGTRHAPRWAVTSRWFVRRRRPDETDSPAAAIAAMMEADSCSTSRRTTRGTRRRCSGSWVRAPDAADPDAGRQPSLAARPILPAPWRADVSADLLRARADPRDVADGTDLRRRALGGTPARRRGGYVRDPGQWDSFGTSLIAGAPLGDERARAPRDRWPADPAAGPRPSCRMRRSTARSSTAGPRRSTPRTSAAETLDAWFRSFDDPEAYVFSHIGWGLDPRRRSRTTS